MKRGLGGFRAALLDFDMTLVNLFDSIDLFALRDDVRGALSRSGFRIDGLHNPPVSLLRTAHAHYTGDEATRTQRWMEASDILCRYETAAAEKALLLHDSTPFLAGLRREGVRAAIVSSNCEGSIIRCLERFGISGYLESIVGRDAVRWNMKPSPLGAELALRALGVEGSSAFGIGDSMDDVRSFNGAGVIAIGITGGVSTRAQLFEAGAVAVIRRLSELGPALDQATRYTSSESES